MARLETILLTVSVVSFQVFSDTILTQALSSHSTRTQAWIALLQWRFAAPAWPLPCATRVFDVVVAVSARRKTMSPCGLKNGTRIRAKEKIAWTIPYLNYQIEKLVRLCGPQQYIKYTEYTYYK